MALDFSIGGIGEFFGDVRENTKEFFDDTRSKITSSLENVKNDVMEFKNDVKTEAEEFVTTATQKFEDISNKADQAFSGLKSKLDEFVDDTLEKTGAFISKTKTVVSETVKKVSDWVTDIENWKKVGASLANGTISFVKGILKFGEALIDAGLILNTIRATIGTAGFDIIKGIVTGEFNWSATKKLWDTTKAVTSYQCMNTLFDKFYETNVGKTLDEYAYKPFKSDGTGCKVLDGIGYVTGIVLLSIVTAGAGGAAAAGGSTATAGLTSSVSTFSALFAGAAGLGKYTEEEWNKNSITIEHNGQEQGLKIDYQKYLEISNLGDGKSTTIEQQVQSEDGSITNITYTITKNGNEYSIVDNNGNPVELKGINESSTAKGLAIGAIKGGWEGFQYWLGGKIGMGSFSKLTGNISNPIAKEATKSAIRVGLDTLTGVAEVPFQTITTMASEGMSWKEAFEASGGWEAVKSQALIASISSFAGEAFQFKGNVVDSKAKTSINSNSSVQSKNLLDKQPNLNNNAMTEIKTNNIDLEDELAFFDNLRKNGTNNYAKLTEIDSTITAAQRQGIDQINSFIRNGQGCIVTYNSTAEISSAMLNQIDDLSKVQIKLLDGLGDAAGSLKAKYLGKQKYIDRITYNGYEMKSILERIENLQSKIDMNLPVEQRAKQIYDVVSAEVPVMMDFANYQYGHHVSASLRGLIPDNLVGKEGLVCAGYASLYKELCDRTGIKCDYVRGKAVLDPLTGSGGGHAWNVVYTDKGMIPVDVTWNASGNGTKNWFGGSDEFVQSHIADLDEFSKDYSGMISSEMLQSSNTKLNKVLSILDSKYGSRDESIKILQKYLSDGNLNVITRTNDARSIISTVDEQSLKTFIGELDVNNKINEVIKTIDQKNGPGYGISALNSYLATGNLNLITRTNDSRQIISSLSFESIQKYLQEFGGLM